MMHQDFKIYKPERLSLDFEDTSTHSLCSYCNSELDEYGCCEDCEERVYCDDGQPSEYEEWQDYYGGDDWDFGQYDEY